MVIMKTMTSRERVFGAVGARPTDCIAVMPYMYDLAAEVAGIPLIDFYTDSEAMAQAQLSLYDKLEQDVIAIGSDNFYIAEGFGCRTTRSPDELPALEEPAVDSVERVSELEIPNPKTDGRMPVMLEAIQVVRAQVGDRVVIRSPGTGPFGLASYLVGSERWLMEIALIEAGMPEAREPAVLETLDLATEALIRFGKACIDAGADILHCGDSLASCDVISPSTFRKFSLPFCRRVFAAWKDYGAACTLLHICGNSLSVLDDYVSTGADLIEIDAKVALDLALEKIGDRAALAGNMDTVNVLLRGTPRIVQEAAEECIRNAKGYRFLLGSGCIVPRQTPLDNLQMLVQTARQHRSTNSW